MYVNLNFYDIDNLVDTATVEIFATAVASSSFLAINVLMAIVT